MKNFKITNTNGIKLKTSNKYIDDDINVLVDSTNLVSENIKNGVEILGVTGTFEGGIPGTRYYIPDSSNKYQLDIVADDANLNRVDITSSIAGDTAVNIYVIEKPTNVALNGGSNENLIGTVNIDDTNYTGSIIADNLVPENIKKGIKILGVTGTMQSSSGSGSGANITSNIKITNSTSDILGTTEHNKLCVLSDTNDLSFKVVNKIEGGSEELSTLSTVLPQGLKSVCCDRYNDDIYIFGGDSSGVKVNTIYKFNCTNKIIETLSVTLPKALSSACCSIYNDNIYIFGGYSNDSLNTIYKFNCTNKTIETLSTTLPKKLQASFCSVYEDNIYIFGGINSNTIYKFNCTSEIIETLSVTLPQTIYNACCDRYNDNIFIFGGDGSSTLNTIYKFNCNNKTIRSLSTTLPEALRNTCCSIFDNNIYIFGGFGGSLNGIYKFNCNNETIETLSETLPHKLGNACCSIYGSIIYIFGGTTGSGDSLNTIYNFSVALELAANNVLIYNANSNYSFDLITDQVTIPVKNVYIGDNNNIRQLASAYLYDQSKSA